MEERGVAAATRPALAVRFEPQAVVPSVLPERRWRNGPQAALVRTQVSGASRPPGIDVS